MSNSLMRDRKEALMCEMQMEYGLQVHKCSEKREKRIVDS
jgi:hypothetical protein